LAASTWKLVVSSLDRTSDSRELTVEGENWLTAVRAARKALGEEGAVPPGASCVMGADGSVIILDAGSRRRFVLIPERPAKRSSRPPLGTLTAVPAPVEAPPAVAATAEASAPSPAPACQGSGEESAKAEAAPGNFTGKPLPRPALGVPASPPPTRDTAGKVPAPRPAEPARPGERASPNTEARSSASMPPAGALGLPAAVAPLPPPPAPSGLPRVAPVRSTGPWRATGPRPVPKPALTGKELQLLAKRDEDPRPQAPLAYRERMYFVDRSVPDGLLEQALRAELARIRDELAALPRGKLVNLAAFDHLFADAPLRGPVATLQWKDWRGDAVFEWAPAGAAPVPQAQELPASAAAHEHWAPAVAAPPPVAESLQMENGSALPPSVSPMPTMPALGFAAHADEPMAHAPVPAHPSAPRAPRPTMGYTPHVLPHGEHAPQGADTTGDHDRRLTQAFEAAQDLYFLATPAAGMDFVVRLLEDLVPCERSAAYLYDINANAMRCVAVTGAGWENRRAQAVPAGSGLMGVAARGRPEGMLIADVAGDTRFLANIDGGPGAAARNLAYFPLMVGPQLVGILHLVNRAGRFGFSDADAAVCAYVATQAAKFVVEQRGRRNG
jgi:hypothetical protein